ncbi:MAG: class II fructose-bisphosphatase [Anaerolineales bacterium]|nr:class II fructose-bisphosphatase [Anaerolineales bacterium]
MSEQLERNLALDLVRVTEGAALAAARWMGRNSKIDADAAAVNAMRLLLGQINIDGTVVIGEGEKDHAPMLYNGERIGRAVQSNGPADSTVQFVDIAVDPIDGTRLLSLGLPNALSVIAIADRGAMFAPGHLVYMDKIAVGPDGRGVIHIDAAVKENLQALARAKKREVSDLIAVILDRPRNQKYVEAVRACGARLKLVTDGDVAAGVSTALEGTGVDILFGIGGSPEGVITAAALKCLGGDMQCKLWPRDDSEREYAKQVGYDLAKTLLLDDLVAGDNVFFAATGITDGEMLRGVHYSGHGATTESFVMRSRSGTIRRIASSHRLQKLMRFSQVEYGA